ncbi:MAG: MATE family efflux transporter [Oscillospiraceae bacterium]|nr:MATE family efflux transporter [Oscillospiraceae bacterium]
MLQKYIGDKAFYGRVSAIALPIIVQNLITNFVSLLDNIMVGQLSDAQISAVSIANNNLLFIFTLCLFGGAAGAGIFTAQFHGSGNTEGIRHAFRFKILICLGITLLGCGIFLGFSEPLISLYLQGEGDPVQAAETLEYGRQYIFIMLLGMLPFAMTNVYASTLRECGHPTVPMVAGLVATAVNMFFNYILIFGKLGAPAMGVTGAATATVIARYVEFLFVFFWTHKNVDKNPYVPGLYRSFYIPKSLLKSIAVRGLPLLINEGLWSLGMALLNQCYSFYSLDVVPALSISTTIYNLSAVVFRSLGNTVGIITGQMLGAKHSNEEIRSDNTKMTVLCIASGVVFAGIAAALSVAFPAIYNTTDSVRLLSTQLILISAITMPLQAYIFPVYFTLRAGGRTVETFLFDCGSIWALSIPAAFILTRLTGLHITVIFSLCQCVDILKCFIGYRMIKKGDWIQNLTVK